MTEQDEPYYPTSAKPQMAHKGKPENAAKDEIEIKNIKKIHVELTPNPNLIKLKSNAFTAVQDYIDAKL